MGEPNRTPPAPEGQAIRDEAGTNIGWCWWMGTALHCTDDRWGIESTHDGGVILAISKAVRCVRARVASESEQSARQVSRLFEICDEVEHIGALTRAQRTGPSDLQRLAELEAELAEIARAQ